MKFKYLPLLLLGVTACNSQESAPTVSLNPITVEPEKALPGQPPVQSATPQPVSTPSPKPVATPSATPVKVAGSVGIVWNGTGACEDGCTLGAATAVTDSGLTVRYVNDQTPMTTPAQIAAIFADARVWVMPGGYSVQEVTAMSTALKEGLRAFISNGGGYVGWCAGAFSATAMVGTSGKPGLGIFPGSTKLYATQSPKNAYGASIEKLTWNNGTRSVYFEGGPFLYNLPSSVEVIGRYDDQVSIATARTTYGNGRVYLSGAHPEAPIWWWSGTSIRDPDGSDAAYAADMVKWAARLE